MNTKFILIGSSALALAAFAFWFYEKQRVKALNERVDTLEDALKKLQSV